MTLKREALIAFCGITYPQVLNPKSSLYKCFPALVCRQRGDSTGKYRNESTCTYKFKHANIQNWWPDVIPTISLKCCNDWYAYSSGPYHFHLHRYSAPAPLPRFPVRYTRKRNCYVYPQFLYTITIVLPEHQGPGFSSQTLHPQSWFFLQHPHPHRTVMCSGNFNL